MNDIKPEHIKQFKKLARAMDKLMREICAYNPEANFYLEDAGNANLMNGPTHDDSKAMNPLHDNVAASESIHSSGGGGW